MLRKYHELERAEPKERVVIVYRLKGIKNVSKMTDVVCPNASKLEAGHPVVIAMFIIEFSDIQRREDLS